MAEPARVHYTFRIKNGRKGDTDPYDEFTYFAHRPVQVAIQELIDKKIRIFTQDELDIMMRGFELFDLYLRNPLTNKSKVTDANALFLKMQIDDIVKKFPNDLNILIIWDWKSYDHLSILIHVIVDSEEIDVDYGHAHDDDFDDDDDDGDA